MTQLPVDPTLSDRNQAVMILQLAETQGWLSYEGLQVAERRGDPDLFRVRLPNGRGFVLERAEVKPWVHGLAAAHGAPDRVAYRPGLLESGKESP